MDVGHIFFFFTEKYQYFKNTVKINNGIELPAVIRHKTKLSFLFALRSQYDQIYDCHYKV